MDAYDEMALVMATIGELHQQGYGRLKLFCYLKDGLGAWRHFVFAGDEFPSRYLAPPHAEGSCPDRPVARGDSVAEAAVAFLVRYPQLALAGRGEDAAYTEWYAQLLAHMQAEQFRNAFEMESPLEALLGHRPYPTPYEARG